METRELVDSFSMLADSVGCFNGFGNDRFVIANVRL